MNSRTALNTLPSLLTLLASLVAAAPASAADPAASAAARRSVGVRSSVGSARLSRTVSSPLQVCVISLTGQKPDPGRSRAVQVVVSSVGEEFKAARVEVLDADWQAEIFPGEIALLSLRPSPGHGVVGETAADCFEFVGLERERVAVTVASGSPLPSR